MFSLLKSTYTSFYKEKFKIDFIKPNNLYEILI